MARRPFETDHSVCERAIVAARDAFSRVSPARIFIEESYARDRELRRVQAADGSAQAQAKAGGAPPLGVVA